jgi:CheY-like chemotaxis protein
MKQTIHGNSSIQQVHAFSKGSSSCSLLSPQPQKTIMVVDDDPAIIEVLKEILRELGFHVVSASDGRKGLELLDTVLVDGVFLDFEMPIMDGPTMLDELRWRGHHMPVLVMTGGYDQPFLHNLVNEGAQGYLLKPFAVEQVIRHCQRLFGTFLSSPVSDFRECVGMSSTAQ